MKIYYKIKYKKILSFLSFLSSNIGIKSIRTLLTRMRMPLKPKV